MVSKDRSKPVNPVTIAHTGLFSTCPPGTTGIISPATNRQTIPGREDYVGLQDIYHTMNGGDISLETMIARYSSMAG